MSDGSFHGNVPFLPIPFSGVAATIMERMLLGIRFSQMSGKFTKELKSLMYGFGDVANPADDTVELMEELLVQFYSDLVSIYSI